MLQMNEQNELTKEQTDALLFECQIDEGAAFQQLWSHVADPAYRWLLRRVRNEEKAKSLLQDTCVNLMETLLKRPHPLEPIHCFISYGVGVSRNSYRRYCRELKRRRRLKYQSLTETVEHADLIALPIQKHRQWQEKIETREILKRLPKRDRSLVVQHYFIGATSEEIASSMDLSQRQVQKDLSRARDRVRRYL